METNEMGFMEEVVDPQNDEVSVDDIMGDGTVGSSPDDVAQPSEPVIRNQADFNAALKTRLQEKEASVARRYQSSPEFMLGQELLRERMQNGISAEQAYQQILDERVKAKAESYRQNPQNFYEDYLRQQSRQEYRSGSDDASSLAEQLISAREMGLLPEDFSPKDITPDFIENVQEFGVRGAAKIFNASRVSTDNVVSRVSANQRLPRPMKTDGINVPPPKLDIEHMSTEDFEKLDQRLSEALAKGRRVRF